MTPALTTIRSRTLGLPPDPSTLGPGVMPPPSRLALVGQVSSRAVGQVAVLATLATLLAGCGRVAVHDPTPDARGARSARALMADLPTQVLDQDRRTVEPGRFSAAWGKPAIVLRCGVAAPPTLTRRSECLEVNGVGWLRRGRRPAG